MPHERFPLDYLMLKFYLKSLDTMITLSKNSTNSLHKICYKKAIIKQLYHPIEKEEAKSRKIIKDFKFRSKKSVPTTFWFSKKI